MIYFFFHFLTTAVCSQVYTTVSENPCAAKNISLKMKKVLLNELTGGE